MLTVHLNINVVSEYQPAVVQALATDILFCQFLFVYSGCAIHIKRVCDGFFYRQPLFLLFNIIANILLFFMQITQFICFVTLFVMQSFAFSHFNMCSKTTLNAFFPTICQSDSLSRLRQKIESRGNRKPHPLGEECGFWLNGRVRTGNYSSSHTLLYLRMTVQRFSTSLRLSSSSV